MGLVLLGCILTPEAAANPGFHEQVAPSTCTWEAAAGTISIAAKSAFAPGYFPEEPYYRHSERTHVALDVDPLDSTVTACERFDTPVAAQDVRAVHATVGSGLTYVWVRPPDSRRGGWMPTWTITPAADAIQPYVVVVVSYDGLPAGTPVNLIGTAGGLDLDGNGSQDVTVNTLGFAVEVLAEGASGLVDLRAMPTPDDKLDWTNDWRRILLGDGDNTVLGPLAGMMMYVETGNGNDRVEISGTSVAVDTGAGNDTIRTSGASNVEAGPGDDDIQTGDANDFVAGDESHQPTPGFPTGNDTVRTGGGRDLVYVAGNDRVWTGAGDDRVRAAPSGGLIDVGADEDELSVIATGGPVIVRCGAGGDELRRGGRLAQIRASGCERTGLRPLRAGESAIGYGPPLAPTNTSVDPRRHDGTSDLFGDFDIHDTPERCTWDPATATITRRIGGAGDAWTPAWADVPSECGGVKVDRATVRRIVVSFASPRAELTVNPLVTATSSDEVKVEFHPAPGTAANSPRLIINSGAPGTYTKRFNIRATREGLDLNADGDLDVTVHAPNWNVHILTERHYGRFDLRAVPTRPHERAIYKLGSRRNVVFGPTSGPDVELTTLGTIGRHPVLEGQSDEITLGPGDDVVRSYGGWDVIDTGAGNDLVDASAGNDVVRTGPGDDQVYADVPKRVEQWARGDDRVWLGPGNDTALLYLGEDITYGGPGNDIIQDIGGLGGVVIAGPGNDEVHGWANAGRAITFSCGTGRDLVRHETRDPATGLARHVGCERHHTRQRLEDWRVSPWSYLGAGERVWW